MRFLLINYEYPPIGAGAANATWHISKCLVEQGHSVGVLTARFGAMRGWAGENGVTVYRCAARRVFRERSNIVEMASFTVGAMLSLPQVIRRLRPDACIVFFSIPGGPVGLLARLAWRIPYVVSLRGGDVPGSEFTLKWTHRLLTPLRRMILKYSRKVVANSDGLKQLTERADPYPACVISSGVDSGYFCPGEPGPDEGGFRVLFVGRFHAQKNLVALVEQFDVAAGKVGCKAMRLDLVGDGPQHAEVEAKIAELGLHDQVALLGWLPRDALLKVYRRADCLVNPSIGEGLPNVVLEAMACGLPVIASQVAGNDTLVKHRENGLLFDVGRPAELGDCLVQLAADRALCKAMGARGRAMALAEYSWSSVARKYAGLFVEP
jgi:glycosyltransferase involved in cell wall biosynthesis